MLMNAMWQNYVSTMELVSTAMVHMSVTALMDGKGNIVEMVIIITIKSLTKKTPVFRFWFSRIFLGHIHMNLDVNECYMT